MKVRLTGACRPGKMVYSMVIIALRSTTIKAPIATIITLFPAAHFISRDVVTTVRHSAIFRVLPRGASQELMADRVRVTQSVRPSLPSVSRRVSSCGLRRPAWRSARC